MAKTSANPGSPAASRDPSGRLTRWGVIFAGGVLVFAAWAAYANSFSTPFVFDDLKTINQNPTIRHLWPLADVLAAPSYVGSAAGRPIVNLSLAINYAIGGLNPKGYHVTNLLIHALAGLALFGIVRRTLLRPGLREHFGGAAVPLALAVALMWVLHPLQTESVTFVVQRSESLMGLFYLLTFYGFVRAVESAAPRRWELFTVAMCLAGMATKEVMVSAPVLVLLYDRTFVAGSFRAAWQTRGRFYLGLAATWLLLAWLVIKANHRGGAAGFGTGVSAWDYALTQCRAIILYLRLSFWPSPLVVDYGMGVDRSLAAVWPQAMLLVLLVAGTLVALWRRPMVGFLGFWFFAILAPSSSIVPLTTQTIAEHRMYLPLAAVVVLAVLGGYRWLGNRSLPVWLALAVLAGWLTAVRNQDYRSAESLWRVTVAAQPENARAQTSLGCALAEAGQPLEALAHLEEAVRLMPGYPDAHFNLGNFLFRQGALLAALEHCEAAVRLRPGYFEAYFVLGGVLDRLDRRKEALERYGMAWRIHPDDPGLNEEMGNVLMREKRWGEAAEHYAAAVRSRPESAALQVALGGALGRLGQIEEAIAHFQVAEALDPNSVAVHYNLGSALFQLRRFAEAAEHYATVVRLQPEFAEAHNNLGNALVQLGRLDEAQAQYEETLRLKPDYRPARNNLARLQALRAGQPGR